MRYAIFSDIHANLDAFNQALADARAQGAQEFICLGDIVGYGPQPAETLARVRETCALTLAGNHDDAVSGRGDASTFIDLASDAVARHRDALANDARAWLRALPWSADIDGATLAHGDGCDPQKFYYIESEEDARANFAALSARVLFVGHTHVPTLFLTGSSGTIYQLAPQDFSLEAGKRYIVNVGSVGYPRETNGRCVSSYVLYDSTEQTVCYRFLPFSVASVLQRGRTPKRLKKRVLACGAILLAVICTALTFLFATAKVVRADEQDAALLVSQHALALAPKDKSFYANLALENDSAPAQLHIDYFDAENKKIQGEAMHVKKALTREMRVPTHATRVELAVRRLDTNALVRIKTFAPAKQRLK